MDNDTGTAFSNISASAAVYFEIKAVPKLRRLDIVHTLLFIIFLNFTSDRINYIQVLRFESKVTVLRSKKNCDSKL